MAKVNIIIAGKDEISPLLSQVSKETDNLGKKADKSSKSLGTVNASFERMKGLARELLPLFGSIGGALPDWQTAVKDAYGDTTRVIEQEYLHRQDARERDAEIEADQIGETERLQQDAVNRTAAAHERATEEMSRYWDGLAQNIESTLASTSRRFLDGEADLLDTAEDLFKDAIAHMAAYAATHAIILPIIQQVVGGNGVGVGSGSGFNLGGGGGFSIPGVTSSDWWNTPMWGASDGAYLDQAPYAESAGTGPTWGSAASTVLPSLGAGVLGYQQSGGNIWGAVTSFVAADLISQIPVVGKFLAPFAGFIGKLFEDRPQPRFGSSGYVPGSFGEFTAASPSDLLDVTKMNSDARESAGTDAAGVQAAYDAVTGGFQSIFKSVYAIMPDAAQDAWDSVSVVGWSNDELSTRKTTGLAIADQLKHWVGGLNDTLTTSLIDATAEAFNPQNGERIGKAWNEKLSAWFDPLLEAASDPEAVQDLVGRYGTYLSSFFTGISGIMQYNNADITGDLNKLMNAGPFDQFRDGLANIKTQIDFINESINDLDGLEYATALATIGDLERQDYETRLQFLYQLKTMEDGLLDSLSAQTESFRWDVMSPGERFNAKSGELTGDWNEIFSATTPEAVAVP